MTPAAYRAALLHAVGAALQDNPMALGAWEGGSAATGRVDEFSDIDLVTVAELADAEPLFALLERVLDELGPIEHRWHVEPAPFAGTRQRFYLLAGAPRFFAFDCVVVEPAAMNQLLDRERHGEACVLFDRTGRVRPFASDQAALGRRRAQRAEQLAASLPVYRLLVAKELARGRPLEAYGFYLAMLRMLLEVLGMHHRPDRFDFGWRYVETQLPPAARAMLARHSFVAGPEWLADHASQLGDELERQLAALPVR